LAAGRTQEEVSRCEAAGGFELILLNRAPGPLF